MRFVLDVDDCWIVVAGAMRCLSPDWALQVKKYEPGGDDRGDSAGVEGDALEYFPRCV
jgi:hypothetical protein